MTRRALEGVCGKCWAHVLGGADADVAALAVMVDPEPLTRAGELLAVLAGRATYDVDVRGALHRRDRWSIRSPGARVLPEHRCGQPPPASWRAAPKRPPAPPAPSEGIAF